MPDIIEILWWLLKNMGKAALKNLQYYIAHPLEILSEIIDYARENPYKFITSCLAIASGSIACYLPPALGFGEAGPILGSFAAHWQSLIGNVVTGSPFAVIQSMTMTGKFAALGSKLIGIGLGIPLLSSLFGRLYSSIGYWFGGFGPGGLFGLLMSSLDASFMERTFLLTANPDAVFRSKKMQPNRGWFLESKHCKVNVEGSSNENTKKRTLITNSKETWDMVWDDMDPWRDGTVKEHALLRFDVKILLFKPKRSRREEKFCEMFIDHDTHCHPDCWCLGDFDDVGLKG